MRRILGLAALLAMAAAPLRADPIGELEAMLAEALEADGVGAAVLLVNDGTGDSIVTAGDARPGTRFYLASTGKPMVAVAALGAVAEGQLSLDAPLGALVADLPLGDIAATRTLRELLGHTSGLPDYLDDAFVEAQYARPDHRWTPAEVLDWADPSDTRPKGSDFDYCNTNYVLLGAILERLDGSLETALTRRVFAPAGMRASTVGADGRGDIARGIDAEGRDVSPMLWSSVLGDGPVVADARDVGRFARAATMGDALLGPALRAEWLTEVQPGAGYGLGIGVERDEFGDWIGHSGGYEGAAADFRTYPARNTVLVVLANGDLDTDAVLSEAAAIWFGD
jgi:D-alanyl-D-alanine carboxypeptidase